MSDRRKLRHLRFFVAAGVLAGSIGAGSPSAHGLGSTDEVRAENALMNQINAYRKNNKKVELKFHGVIRREERRHAAYMSNNNVLNHNGFKARAARIKKADPEVGAMCENVAFFRNSAITNPVDAAKQFLKQFKGSRGHNACLLDRVASGGVRQARSIGVGIEQDNGDPGRWHVALIIAQDKDPGTR